MRGEFGYWVFEGPEPPGQRPSWNYRAEDGGGILADMLPHWQYVLDDLFGPVRGVYTLAATHIGERTNEQGERYEATAEDAAYTTFELEGGIVAQINASWCVRVDRDELFELQVDGTDGSAVAGLRECRIQTRGCHPGGDLEPRRAESDRLPSGLERGPRTEAHYDNGFKVQWELFLRHVVAGDPFPWDLFEGARGIQLAELAERSWRERRMLEVPELPGVSVSSAAALLLPRADGSLEQFVPGAPAQFERPRDPLRSRAFLAAAHVVADPLAGGDSAAAAIDWDATLGYRRHLWSWGLGVAEAMDTAQRGMGLGWPEARELIKRSAAAARESGGRLAAGAGTDQLPAGGPASLGSIRDAYLEQCAFVEEQGCQPIVMASRALAAAAEGPADYRSVYDAVLGRAGRPVILHWLGEMFDPALAGYWGAADPYEALDVVTGLIAENAGSVDGIKLSLLDDALELRLRDALPDGVRLYTGDDFNYPALIAAGSDALLGVFDAIAPAASAALQALDAGDEARFAELLAPTVPLARRLFASPTYHYKTGLVFLAWLNGHQRHFRMIGGQEGARTLVHLAELLRLADGAGLLADPALACERMRRLLTVAGVDQ